MGRAWKWLGALAALLLLGASDGTVGEGSAGIELLRLRERLGTPGGPIEIGIWDYRAPGSTGRIWIATLDPSRIHLQIVPAATPAPLSSVAADQAQAGDYVAINGGFYDADKPMGLVVARGERKAPLRRGGGSGVFLVQSATPEIVHREDPLAKSTLDQAVQSIDRLVDSGEVLVRVRPGLPRDARSAVAIDYRGFVHLVAIVDDRALGMPVNGHISLGPETTSTGPTLWETAEFLARPTVAGGLGARAALNLDGGFSTALQARIGGREFSLAGYRGTINAVVGSVR